MEESVLVNLDSESFWKWWSGATKRIDKKGFRSILVDVQGWQEKKKQLL
ncbi:MULTISPECIES: hypothetical protein [Desulfitobacterium]|nr:MULTISPECIES: hypothetical protein [Desulfitobacterium]